MERNFVDGYVEWQANPEITGVNRLPQHATFMPYASFEEAGVSGENLSQAKAKIEKTMDSIVAGFEHQLDELYRTDAMDIDSDIRVMENMLRRDTASVEDDFGLGGTAVQRAPDEE